ncbi:four helix bundle protein [Rickettsiales bacterium]|nr:four helix bundle protein [Rickettsiales bacterium]
MKKKVNIIQSYKDLKVWQKAIALVEFIYKETASFPKEEVYCLTNQIRRCAISIPSNIAEGSSRRSTKEFIRFVNISYGSLCELETQITIADRLKYINRNKVLLLEQQTKEIGMILNGLRNSLYKKLNSEL